MCWIKYVVVREYYILYNTPTVHDYYQNEMDNQIMKWRLFQKRVVRTKFDIYVFILIQVELIYVNDEVNV